MGGQVKVIDRPLSPHIVYISEKTLITILYFLFLFNSPIPTHLVFKIKIFSLTLETVPHYPSICKPIGSKILGVSDEVEKFMF